MAKRTKIESAPMKEGWKVTEDGKMTSTHATQKESEAVAIARGNAIHDAGGLAQAKLKKSDGTIREERTYGSDPRKTKG